MAKPPLRGAMLYVQEHADTEEKEPRNGDDSCSSDGVKEEELMVVKSDAAIRTTPREMLRAMFGGALSPTMGKYSRAVHCLHGAVQREHTSTLASRIKRAHPSVYSELMVAGASSREKDEGCSQSSSRVRVGVCVRCSVFTYRFEQQQPMRSHEDTRLLRA